MQQKDATDRFNICQVAGAGIGGGEKTMMSFPTEVFIKVKSLEEMKEVLSELRKIKEDNPNEVFKTTIEIAPEN